MEVENKGLDLDEFHMKQFLRLLANIEPVKARYSSEEMIQMLREGEVQQLLDSKNKAGLDFAGNETSH